MNLKEKSEQIKNWAKENKGKILIGVGVASAFIMTAVISASIKEEREHKKEEEIIWNALEELDSNDKDIIMQYVDPGTNEVLWKEICSEEYYKDMKENGMQYAEVRKLNGIEETES